MNSKIGSKNWPRISEKKSETARNIKDSIKDPVDTTSPD